MSPPLSLDENEARTREQNARAEEADRRAKEADKRDAAANEREAQIRQMASCFVCRLSPEKVLTSVIALAVGIGGVLAVQGIMLHALYRVEAKLDAHLAEGRQASTTTEHVVGN